MGFTLLLNTLGNSLIRFCEVTCWVVSDVIGLRWVVDKTVAECLVPCTFPMTLGPLLRLGICATHPCVYDS